MRGMVVTHGRTGKPFATKYAHSVFGQERETIEEAYPGDVVGLGADVDAVEIGAELFHRELDGQREAVEALVFQRNAGAERLSLVGEEFGCGGKIRLRHGLR